MFKPLPGALAGAALLLAFSHNAWAQGKPMKLVSQSVSVDTRAGRVVVQFTVNNRTEANVFVPKAVASDKELSAQVFEIRSGGGDPVAYTGPVVKRKALGADDFTEIRARMRHRNKIDITDSYDFKKGTHHYELTYVGSYLSDPHQLGKLSTLALAPVQFTYTGR
ncbi:hypothetical protein [Massilia glaciei]|uniref:DUF4426 domain-containing protein n=1 Tax=Massilia glaciei TaxID=1524097 RepID=A0A2U2HN06_9BURK|nr:hypothetical protein [Massilia glaciei]PWF48887.1 hypothetical protein C7C56_009200 [Massilia glaciei]